jgi:hypothetical protein
VLLEQLTQPLLLVWGSRDSLVPPSVRHQVQRHRPNLDLVLLEGAGHCPTMKIPNGSTRPCWPGYSHGPSQASSPMRNLEVGSAERAPWA